ncbi:unnamed protein product, partial [Rotaria magnacalcarata]
MNSICFDDISCCLDLSLRLQNRTDVESDSKDDKALETISTIVHPSN